MTTTIMRNSIVGDQWIRDMQVSIPPQKVIKDGKWTGDILSGPVRLSFVNLFKKQEKREGDQGEPKFNATLLFPPPLPGQNVAQQFALFYEEYYRICAEKFASHWNGQSYAGLHSPFHDQGEKFKYDGYTTGSCYFTVSSQYKPPIVSPIPGSGDFNPVVDESQVYPGVWAIVSMNAYAYGVNAKGPQKKGPGFGIQSVVIFANDTNLAGAKAADPKTQFGNIAAGLPALIARPDFSKLPGQPGAAPPQGIPGPTFPGVPTQMPGMPTTIETTYRPAPPPPSPADDPYDFS